MSEEGLNRRRTVNWVSVDVETQKIAELLDKHQFRRGERAICMCGEEIFDDSLLYQDQLPEWVWNKHRAEVIVEYLKSKGGMIVNR